jgi:hypothetical protein
LPTVIGAVLGAFFGAGGGVAGAMVGSVLVGGLMYLISGTKNRPGAGTSSPPLHVPVAVPAAFDPFENTILDDVDDPYADLLAVLDEALAEGAISETQYEAIAAIGRRRLLGMPGLAEGEPEAIEEATIATPEPVDRFEQVPTGAPMQAEIPSEPAVTARAPDPFGGPIESRPPAPAWSARLTPPQLDWAAVTDRLRSVWGTLASDFALHGLAYAGVLLVFVATFGFVVFAFAGVRSGLRPVAEAAIPIMLFGAARFLRHRGAPFVSRSLQFLAGAVTPIVAFAAFQDGAGFPPDLDGAPLVIVLTAIALGLAGAYARLAGADAHSPLRYLVAPLVWVAAGVVGLAFRSEPSAAQMSLVMVAITATVIWAGTRTAHPLSKPLRDVALPGSGVVLLLLVLFAADEGWPALPGLVAGLSLIALTEILPLRFRYPSGAQIGIVMATAVLVAPQWGAGVAAAGTAVLFIGFTELWLRRPADDVNVPLGAVLAGIALTASVVEAGPVLVVATFVGVWGHVRRISVRAETGLEPGSQERLGTAATAAAVAAPVLAASGLWRLVGAEPAIVVSALVTAGAALGVWRFARTDMFYAFWVPGTAGTVVGATVPVALEGGDARSGLLAAGTCLAGLAFAAAPRWSVLRVWFASVSFLWGAVLGLEAVDVALRFRAPALAVLGAVTVVAAAAGRGRVFGHLALFGHLVTAGSLVAAGTGGPALVTLAAFTAGWVAETVSGLAGRGIVQLPVSGYLPERVLRTVAAGVAPVLAAVSLPVVVADLATFFDIVTPEQRGRMALLQSGLALAYAVVARLTVRRRPVGPIFAIGGFFLSAVGIAIAAPEPWPSIAALGASIGVVAVIGGELRRSVMTWIAWTMSVVLIVLLADRAGIDPGHLYYVVLAWGGSAFIGGLLIDDLRAGRRTPGEGLRLEWVLRPVALGALAIPVALSIAIEAGPRQAWPSVATAAVFYGIAALLLRAGSVSVVFYSLVAYAVALVLEPTTLAVTDHPWVLTPVTLGLVGASFVAWSATRARDPWLRWDLPPLVVAHAVAVIAMLLTDRGGSVPAVFAAHGGIALAIAAWRRRWVWAVAGSVLVLVGAAAAGPGWLALAAVGLGGLAQFSAMVSVRFAVVLRWAAVVLTALAWIEAAVWRDWWPDPALLITACGGGGLAVVLAAAFRSGRLTAEWALPWATLAVGAVGAAAIPVLGGAGSGASGSLGVAFGLAGLSVASGMAAARLDPLLRSLAALLAGGVGPMLIHGYLPSGGTIAALAAPVGLAASVSATLLWHHRSSVWSAPLVLLALLVYGTGVAGGAQAGATGWLALLFGSMSAASVAGAGAAPADLRVLLRPVSAVFAAVGWGSLVDWAGWWPDPAVAATIVGTAGVGLVLALSSRLDRLDPSWTHAWGVTALLVWAVGIVALPGVGREIGGLAAASGLVIWAVAFGIGAGPLGLGWLREAVAIALLGSGIALGYALEPGLGQQVAAALVAGLIATVIVGAFQVFRPESPWIRPAAVYATGAQLGAVLAALQALPQTGLLSAALAAVGIEALVLGGLLRVSAFLYAGPPLLLTAWLLFAIDAFGGNPQWYTIPIGATILVLVDLVRWDGRRRALPLSPEVLAYSDYAGMAFMVGASLIQVVTRSSVHGLIGIVAGLVILAWSAVVQLRRRAWGGATAVVSAAVLMVAVPLARIVPQFRGIALWATIAAIGALLIAVASTLERGKARVAETVKRLDELMEGWE